MAFEGPVTFAAELLVGAFALYVAGRYVVYRNEFAGTMEHAALTALLGAVVWALLAGIPLVGGILAFAGWFLVVRWRYPGSTRKAAIHAAVAWAVASLVTDALALVGLRLGAAGLPGV